MSGKSVDSSADKATFAVAVRHLDPDSAIVTLRVSLLASLRAVAKSVALQSTLDVPLAAVQTNAPGMVALPLTAKTR